MKFIALLPWKVVIEGESAEDGLDAALFALEDGEEARSYCEMADSPEHGIECHTAKLLMGTSDSCEPKFCLTHYFAASNGDGKDDYKIVPLTAAIAREFAMSASELFTNKN